MLQDKTSTRSYNGAGINSWQLRGEGGVSSPQPATRLLVAGPTQGEWLVESETFVVSADGALSAPVTVTPTVTAGGTGTFDPVSATLSSGGTVQFTFTPSSIATLTLAFQALGLTQASASYDSVVPAPDVIDLSDKWLIDLDPTPEFLLPLAATPAGVVAHAATSTPYSPALAAKAGTTIKVRAAITLGINENTTIIRNLDGSGADDGVTASEVLVVPDNGAGFDPTYAMFARVADPDNPAKWSFRHQGDKTKIGWSSSTVKWRSYGQATGDARFDPWGAEIWVASSLWLDANWALANRGPFHDVLDIHDGPGGLTGGAAFQVDLQPGAGDPNGIQFEFTVKRYRLSTWPQNQNSKNKDNYNFASNIVGGLQTETQYWLVLHYKTGNGFPDYPGYVPGVGNPGAPVWGTYGSTDPTDPFIELYLARENGLPELLFRWDNAFARRHDPSLNGFWGSPHKTADSAASKQLAGYSQVGLYTSSSFQPSSVGNALGLYTKGMRQYRAKDAPGMSVFDVLADFKAHR